MDLLSNAGVSLWTLAGVLQDGTGSGGSGSGGSGSGPGQGGSSSGPTGSGTTGSNRPGSGQNGQGNSGNSTSGQPGSGQGGTGQNSTGQNSTGQNSTGQTSQPASAARLAADQAAIDAAEAQLTAAEQNLAAATLTSPAEGTIAAIGLTPGSSASGGTITIVGTGIQGVAISVPLAQVDLVKAGQPVTVSADGVSTQLHGKVESIGLLSSTSGSRTTFPVTVRLDAGTPKLYDGSGADAVISAGTARNVITVPNSAIHTAAAGIHTVTVVKDGKTTTMRVTLGLTGPDVTQVKSGLHAGQRVVLADPSEPLPSSTTNGSTSTFRFPGGGNLRFPGGRVGG